jgi:hypothetical protein
MLLPPEGNRRVSPTPVTPTSNRHPWGMRVAGSISGTPEYDRPSRFMRLPEPTPTRPQMHRHPSSWRWVGPVPALPTWLQHPKHVRNADLPAQPHLNQHPRVQCWAGPTTPRGPLSRRYPNASRSWGSNSEEATSDDRDQGCVSSQNFIEGPVDQNWLDTQGRHIDWDSNSWRRHTHPCTYGSCAAPAQFSPDHRHCTTQRGTVG